MVGADRAGPVAQVGLEQHQRAVAGLLQRLELDPAAGGGRRPGQVARPAPGPRRAGRTGRRTAGRAPTGPRAASRRTARAAGRPCTGPGPRSPWASDLRVVPGRGGRDGRLPLDVEDAQVDPAGLGVAPAQVPGRHDQRRLARRAPGAGGAARGAGWSAPARRSTPARTARRCAAGPAATRRGRPGTRPGPRCATSEPAGPLRPSLMACSPRRDRCSISTRPPGIENEPCCRLRASFPRLITRRNHHPCSPAGSWMITVLRSCDD